MKHARIAAVVAVLTSAGAARAEPILGTSLGYGEGLGGEADHRVSSNLFAYAALPGGWTVGGELAGSFEGYTGGYGCGTIADTGDTVVPSVAVSCLQPGVAVHALAGVRAAPSPATRLRLEVGVGAASIYLIPGSGGDTTRDTLGSGLIRAAYLARAGSAFTGEWWLGLQLEERAIGFSDPTLSRSIGLVLEARSLD